MSANEISNMVEWNSLLANYLFRTIYNAYLDENPAGGSLHIVLSDGNNSDDDIIFCMEKAMERKDWVAVYLAENMLKVKHEDRELYQWICFG